MKGIRIVAPIAIVVAASLAACEQPAQETGGMEEGADTLAAVNAEAQLDSLRMAYEEAWAARDWDAISGMMTSDYQEIGPEGVLGYDQAIAMMRDSANMPPEGARLSIDMRWLRTAWTAWAPSQMRRCGRTTGLTIQHCRGSRSTRRQSMCRATTRR